MLRQKYKQLSRVFGVFLIVYDRNFQQTFFMLIKINSTYLISVQKVALVKEIYIFP